MTTVWRIGYCENPALPAATVLSTLGFGSTLGNGRWHVKGAQQVVYAASNRALCQLEKRVHSNGANPKNQALMQLEIPEGSPLKVASDLGLPADWHSNEAATQAIGLEWLLPSPPPAENFEENVPTVISGPYGYGTGKPLVENQSAYENQSLLEA